MVCLDIGEESFQPVFGTQIPSRSAPAALHLSPIRLASGLSGTLHLQLPIQRSSP